MREITGRAHNLCPGDAAYLTDRGWVTVHRVDASPAAEVVIACTAYGVDGPVSTVRLPWDAPIVVAVSG